MTKIQLVLLCLFLGGQAALADETVPAPPAGAGGGQSVLNRANGLLTLDYEQIRLKGGGNFDLFGVHYLHRFNDWLYWGGGLSGPMLEGDYGGFFALDVSLHAQKRLFGNWFADAGVGVGAGAGGASIHNIPILSGTGAYLKEYAGIGYETGKLNFGVNVARVRIAGSQVDDTTLNVFVQKPLSFSLGAYADAGDKLGPADFGYRRHETMVSFEYSNLTQINPTGKYTGEIGLVSPQFSQFYDANDYFFLGLDLGYSGLIWYNQAQGGFGHRFSLAPHVNLYAQLGVGSAGWVTDTIDTGPGLVVYPKVKAEYLWDNGVGAYVSAGYLAAPKGTSRNWSVGAGLSYHLAPAEPGATLGNAGYDQVLRGVRINLYDRRLFDAYSNDRKIGDLNLLAVQVDVSLNRHWYLPLHVSAATNEYKGYAPGYVEGLVGLGWQSGLFAGDRWQGFAQVLYGMNDLGINAQKDVGALLNASLGVNYSLNDQYSLYAQVGKTVSLGQYFRKNFTNNFGGTSVGVGLTYRFSLPARVSR